MVHTIIHLAGLWFTMLLVAPSVAIIIAVATSSILDPIVSGILSAVIGLTFGVVIYCLFIKRFKK